MEKNEGSSISIETIARIGQLFLDGDDLQWVLLDRMDHTDYDFDRFNRLKRTLLLIERIAPERDLAAILWQAYSTNPQVGAPLVAGSSLPLEGCKRQQLGPQLRRAMEQGESGWKEHPGGERSFYCPVYNSNGEITGALELLYGLTEKVDVSCNDMFVEQKEEDEG